MDRIPRVTNTLGLPGQASGPSSDTTTRPPRDDGDRGPAAAEDRARREATRSVEAPCADEPASSGACVRSGAGLSGVQLAAGVTLDPSTALPQVAGKPARQRSDVAEALYILARSVDREGEAILGRLTPRLRQTLFTSVRSATSRQGASAGGAALSPEAELQLRSSAATVLAALVGTLAGDESREGRSLLAEAVRTAAEMARAEPDRRLRESMIFSLYRYQTRLPKELRPPIQALMREAAPLAPPYEKWLADGKVTIEIAVDDDSRLGPAEKKPWTTVADQVSGLAERGFSKVSQRGDAVTMRQTVLDARGRETVIEVVIREARGAAFKNIGRSGTDIVIFYGHSDYGRALEANIQGAPKADGANQLAILLTCTGVVNLHSLQRQFAGVQLLASVKPLDVFDGGRLLDSLVGMVRQRPPWTKLKRDITIEGFGEAWLTPVEPLLRRRMLDADNDGRADSVDRLFDLHLGRPGESTEETFTPRDPGRPPHRLQTLHLQTTANWLNGPLRQYNDAVRALEPPMVIPAGFYSGGPDAAPVRFRPTTLEDGTPAVLLEQNAHFSHLPEDAVRAIATFELNLYLARDSRYLYHRDRQRLLMNGLMAAQFALQTSLRENSQPIWKALMRAYGFGEQAELGAIQNFRAGAIEGVTDSDASTRDGEAGSTLNIDHALRQFARSDWSRYAPELGREGSGVWRRAAAGPSS